MMQYLIVIEKTETGYSAYSPDLSGCISTGETFEEIEQNMREAMEFHLDGMVMQCRTAILRFDRFRKHFS